MLNRTIRLPINYIPVQINDEPVLIGKVMIAYLKMVYTSN